MMNYGLQRFGVRLFLTAILMKTECAPVNNDQNDCRSVKFDGSVEATVKTVKVRDPNVRLGPRNDVAVIDGAPKRTTNTTTESRTTKRGQVAGQQEKTTDVWLELAAGRRTVVGTGNHIETRSMVNASSMMTVIVPGPYSRAGPRNVTMKLSLIHI